MEMLRKLDGKECAKIRSGAGENFISVYRIRSQIDLYSNLDKVKAAIQIWKKSHKLLRTKVDRIDQDLCFVLNKASLANLENVMFLRIVSASEMRKRTDDSISDLVIEIGNREML